MPEHLLVAQIFFGVMAVISFQFCFSYESREKYGQALQMLGAGAAASVLFVIISSVAFFS